MTSLSAEYFNRVFAKQSVMAILRGLPPDDTVAVCETAWAAGIDVVEVPVQTPDALPSLDAAITAARTHGRAIGAGTVTSFEQVDEVRRRGVEFTVAPGFDADVCRASETAGMAHLPGVATASEITQARAIGHIWQKAFPAAQLTPGWFRAQSGPFPDVRFVATGGVGPANAADFLAAGCRVVAVGSALSDSTALRTLAAL